MARKTVARTFVYALLKPDGSPFYIGIASRNDRLSDHIRQSRIGTTAKCRIIRKIIATGHAVPLVKLIENLPWLVAAQIERDVIALIGRRPKGPLTNLTDGGEGLCNPSKSTRRLMAKNGRDPAIRAARIAGFKKTIALPEVRRRLKDGIMEAWSRPEVRANHAAADRARNERPEERARRTRVMKERWSDPQNIARQSEALKRGNTPEVRARKGASNRAAWADPQSRAMRMQKRRATNALKRKLPLGVYAHSDGRFWAQIRHDGRHIRLGTFNTIEDAKAAFDAADRKFNPELHRAA